VGSYIAEIRTVDLAADELPRPADPNRFVLSHHLADEAEIRVEKPSGGHLLHLAVAGCVFNSVFRIAAARNVALRRCRVSVDGNFDDVLPSPREFPTR